jgi:abortive infection Abi-like protein
MEMDQIAQWLADSGDGDAATILRHSSLNWHFVDSLMETGGGRDWDLVDVDIQVPAKFMTLVRTSLAPVVPRIEGAIRDFAKAEGTVVRAIAWLPKPTSAPAVADLAIMQELTSIDSVHVRKAWDKAMKRRRDDPEGAITAARAILETVCKHILHESHVHYEESAELPRLYHTVTQHLKLAPSQQLSFTLRRILGNIEAVVGGVAQLRNDLSDSHGKAPDAPLPDAAMTDLVVTLAGATSAFLVATWEKMQGSSPPNAAPAGGRGVRG